MSSDVLFSRGSGEGGDVGRIHLNRPQALNALTNEMCKYIRAQLLEWEEDNDIKAVVITGEGDRAFCAGGDVKSMYYHQDDTAPSIEFFTNEYRMNKTIFHFPKPYIAICDGLTMGGGAGVSLHGSHAIATERTRFAMPETAIGFFPDIGASYFLNQCPFFFGEYLALTGLTISAEEAVALNIFNYKVDSNKVDDVLSAICETDFVNDPINQVTKILGEFREAVARPELLTHEALVDQSFCLGSVEAILEHLSEIDFPFSHEALKALLARSPTSLKVTLACMQKAKELSFDEVMQMDYVVAHHFIKGHDFYEGVRAALVDKDKNPQWQPDNISDVTADDVDSYFIGDTRL